MSVVTCKGDLWGGENPAEDRCTLCGCCLSHPYVYWMSPWDNLERLFLCTRCCQRKAALNFLRQQYPRAFCSPPRPLARNTTGTLLERHSDSLGRVAIFPAVRLWTNWVYYQRALVPGVIRYDLDGQPAGVVTEEEVIKAKAKLEEANRRRKERWRCFHERKAHSHIS
jgi:sRNA-binding protein